MECKQDKSENNNNVHLNQIEVRSSKRKMSRM